MLPNIFVLCNLFLVAWMFRSVRFKTIVYYWHENNNTSSILAKWSWTFEITRPKKVIPTKSYSLSMLHHPHTTKLNHAQPRYWPSNCFRTLTFSNLFQLLTQYMSVSHGYSTIGGIECGGGCETKKEEMVTLTWRIKGLWRCPLIDINVNE